MAAHGGPNIIKDSITASHDVANKKSYSGTGTSILDLSGNNKTGTIVAAPTYSSTNGGIFTFNGTNHHLSMTNPVTSNLPYTILQWIKPDVALTDTTVTDGTGRKTPLCGPGPQWSPGYWLTARNFRVHAYTEYRDHTINLVGDTSWHLIGQVFDGTNCFGILDGVILSGGTRTAYSPGLQTNLLIGAETATGNSFNWNGKVSLLTSYNRALTSQQVRQNFQAMRGRFGI